MNQYLTLKDHVYYYLSEKITSGELSPEDKINEQDISDVLNISRTPVREALIQLSSEGYLDNFPRKGFYVKKMSKKRAEDLYELIGLLDGYIGSQVIDKITDQDLEEMKLIVTNLDFYIDSKQYDKYYKNESLFHNVYIQKMDNKEIVDNLNSIRKNFIRKNLNYEEHEDQHEILKKTNKQHLDIIQLFEDNKANDLFYYLKDIHWSKSTARFNSW